MLHVDTLSNTLATGTPRIRSLRLVGLSKVPVSPAEGLFSDTFRALELSWN